MTWTVASTPTPDVLLGVYTPEEHQAGEVMRDMGAVEEVPRSTPAVHPAQTTASRTEDVKQRMKRNAPAKLADVLRAINDADNAEALTAAGELATKLASDADKETARQAYAAKLQASRTPKPEPDSPVANAKKLTYAEVADALNAAVDDDALAAAADLIRYVTDEGQRAELTAAYSDRAAKFDDTGSA